MKKFFAVLAVFSILSVFSFSCAAASDTMTAEGSKDVPVYVNIVSEKNDNLHKPEADEDGNFEIETNGGVKIEIAPEDNGGDTAIVVYEIPDTDDAAKDWLDEQTKDIPGEKTYYEFVLESDKEDPSAKVTMDIPEGCDGVSVAFVDENGEVTKIESKTENGKISFDVTKSGIYAFVYEEAEGSTDTDDTPVAPPSSDFAYAAVATVAIASVVILAVAKKRKEEK